MRLAQYTKGKGSVLDCGNYIGIKLMSHTMKLWERIIENRIREIVELRNIQFEFRRGMSTTVNRTNICTENITRKVPRKKEGMDVYVYCIC